MSAKKRFHIDKKKKDPYHMSDTNVSKVLGFINRSIIDFNFGIVSILDFQEKYFNPEKVFFLSYFLF